MAWTAISPRYETPPPIARGGWLDALRFIVAALIVLHHFQAAGPHPLAETVHPVFERGGFLLTNFFLIDSGYVLMRIYGGQLAAGRMTGLDFVLKRVLRVFPAHLIMGLGLVALVLVGGAVGFAPRNPEWFRWDQLPAQLTLTQSLGVLGGLGWNAPSWSISALIGCYLLFPWLLQILRRLGPWTALLGVVALYLLANALTWALLGYPIYQMPLAYGLIRALPLFVLGMALAVVSERVFIAPRLARITLLSAAIGLATVQAFDKHALLSLIFISLILLAAGAIPVTRPSKLVERAAVVSFALFISNEVVRIAWFGAVNAAVARFDLPEPAQWALWAAGVLAAFVFAFAFNALIDQPLQARIKGWLKRRGRRAAAERPAASLEG